MHIIPLSERYLDFALLLTQSEHWGTPRSELEALFHFRNDGIFLAMDNQTPIGMTFCVPYNNFGFIGEVIVKDGNRRQGIGQKLMKRSMDFFSSLAIDTIMLDSVVPAIHIYEQLGFRKICKSLRLNGIVNQQYNDRNIRRMERKDLPLVFEIDRREFGADRSFLLSRKFDLYPEFSFVAPSSDGINGYIFAHPDENGIKVGPWMAHPDKLYSEDLIHAVAFASKNKLLSLGCLETNENAIRLLNHLSFNTYGYSYRMVFGPEVSLSKHLYAIGGPDRG